MMQLTVKVPEALANLPSQEQDILIQAGLWKAADARLQQLKGEMERANNEIHHFETRYGVTFQRFESEKLQQLDTLQAHKDYNDWFYWIQVRAEKERLLSSLQNTVSI